jgi:hypothetical protein
MKKFTFALMIAAVMVFAAAPLFAEGMTFGIKAGLNMANLTGDDVKDTSIKIGMAGGVFMSYEITKIFAVQPEVLFIMKGAKGKADDATDVKWNINYVEIPILIKANLPTEGKIKPFLAVGPGIGILISSKQADGTSVDVKDYTKSTNIGIIAGAGVAYQMEKASLSLEARYEMGLATIAKNAAGDDSAVPKIKTSDISILVGYGFAF